MRPSAAVWPAPIGGEKAVCPIGGQRFSGSSLLRSGAAAACPRAADPFSLDEHIARPVLCEQKAPSGRILRGGYCFQRFWPIDRSGVRTLQRFKAPAVEVDRFQDSCYDGWHLGRGSALIDVLGSQVLIHGALPGVSWKPAPSPCPSSRDGLSSACPTTTTRVAARGPARGRS